MKEKCEILKDDTKQDAIINYQLSILNIHLSDFNTIKIFSSKSKKYTQFKTLESSYI